VISVIIPALNAENSLPETLESLFQGAFQGLIKEVIVADGGSSDATCAIADAAGAEVVTGARGRGPQLIAGAARARAKWLLFLHADTKLTSGWEDEALAFLQREFDAPMAATFRFAFDAQGWRARQAELWVAVRCAVFKLPYGDQGLLISRAHYDALGGYKPWPLFEDVDLVRRIGGARLQILKARAITSAVKYHRDGYFKRGVANLWLLARYLMGARPEDLAKSYD
jgi:rSAM/selenodomain-associated transferase 2